MIQQSDCAISCLLYLQGLPGLQVSILIGLPDTTQPIAVKRLYNFSTILGALAAQNKIYSNNVQLHTENCRLSDANNKSYLKTGQIFFERQTLPSFPHVLAIIMLLPNFQKMFYDTSLLTVTARNKSQPPGINNQSMVHIWRDLP